MPLTIEDGTKVAEANSYATRAEIIAYAAARGVVIADDASTDILAIKAMDYIEGLTFIGLPTYGLVGFNQALQFPRKNIFFAFNGIVFDYLTNGYENIMYGSSGEEVPNNAIPLAIKNAQCEAAVIVFSGIDLSPNISSNAAVKSEKIGPIETEYFAPPGYRAQTPRLDALLKPWIVVGSRFKVTRG